MSENTQMMSLEGQLCGMPLAGPESFSQQQLDYLKRALGVDETVLFENDNILANWPGDKSVGQYSIVLSEDYKNFEKLEVHFARSANLPTNGINYVDTYVFKTLGKFNVVGSFFSSGTMYFASTEYNASSDGKTLTESAGGQWSNNSFNTSTCYLHIFKVVGVHRISGGNQ